jgi:catalase
VAAPDLSGRLVDSLAETYGSHPGNRAAHAKGVLCAATFTPTPAAAALSRAPHFAGPPVRAHVRFSNGSGNPTVADAVRDARGMAVKLYLPDGTTTDIVAISLPVFFARTPEDLLAFNEARRPDPATGAPDLERVGAYLSEHPEALPAVSAVVSHPIPRSFATLAYHAIHAFGFVDPGDVVRFGRYDLAPAAGVAAIADDEAESCPPGYLRTELAARLAAGPVGFGLDVTLAGPDDPLDDPTAQWPGEREVVRVGHVSITGFAHDRERSGDVLVFDPTRVPDGVVLSADPILLARPGAYSVSVARRTPRSAETDTS